MGIAPSANQRLVLLVTLQIQPLIVLLRIWSCQSNQDLFFKASRISRNKTMSSGVGAGSAGFASSSR